MELAECEERAAREDRSVVVASEFESYDVPCCDCGHRFHGWRHRKRRSEPLPVRCGPCAGKRWARARIH